MLQVETEKKTLLLHGKKTNSVLNQVLTEIHILKKGDSIKYTRKNDNIRPFEAGGETNLEFFSQKTDCGLFLFASDSKKRPNNLVMGRFYDHHIYDMVEVGVENFKSLQSFSYNKKFAPKMGSKPLIAFMGEGFESNELKHLKEVLLDLLRGEVVDKLNIAGVDRIYVCTAVSDNKVFLTHCGLRLKKSGTTVPKIELIEVGPSMDLVVRRHRLPNEGLRKEAMKSAPDRTKKKLKNVKGDPILGKTGRIYIPDQKVGEKALPYKAKGMKRERRESKMSKNVDEQASKKQKADST
ncbi:hypothetical protein RND81_01G184000 [Saponaria officinalis]|uniref:Ribosome production factor 2 homolog n=1 Tax=Saponaria officinalis TaxID=3572 RepID=A0AAW1N8I4_SAPOF